MILNQIYKPSLALLTDLYQLTMAYGYWKSGRAEKEAVFHLFFRKHPFKGNYTIAAGLQYAIDFVQQFQFSEADISYLAQLTGNDGEALFEQAFLEYLKNLRFTGNIDAIPEGTVMFPHQPLLRFTGKLIVGQLLETALLNMLNFQSLIATKAARVCQAAQGDAVLEFGLRRAQGIDGALAASRAAYLGGCSATSNVLAGRLFGIPVKGTHAHSWVMSFADERIAFEAYAEAMPNNCVFLVDTYDTIEGVKKAIEVGKRLRDKGYSMNGIRLDSGDMTQLSIEARQLLDESGFIEAKIVASNDLDEYKIAEMKANGAKIAVWGVGTKLVTAYDQPALGGVYKLAAIKNEGAKEWEYRIKKSENPIKISNPGILQVRRFQDKTGQPIGDVLFNELKGCSQELVSVDGENTTSISTTNYQDILIPIFQQGKLIYQSPNLHESRTFTQTQVALFSKNKNYPTGLCSKLYQLRQQMLNTL